MIHRLTTLALAAALCGALPAGEDQAPAGKEEGIRMPPAEVIAEITKHLLDDPDGKMTDLGKRLLGKDGTKLFFYLPTRDEAGTPRDHGLGYHDVVFASRDGTRLHGWFIPAKGAKPRATIVFSHGNAGSLGHHLPFITWLPAEGFNVFLYDYRGYGKSEGSVERRGLVEDAAAAFRTAARQPEVDPARLVSLSHSLGGAKSVAALALDRPAGLRAVAVVSGFASYRQMARIWGGNVGANLTDDQLAPQDLIGKLAPVPVLVMHGEADEVIPFAEGRVLAAAARDPKEFIAVPNGRHNDLLARDDGKWRRRLLEWIARQLETR